MDRQKWYIFCQQILKKVDFETRSHGKILKLGKDTFWKLCNAAFGIQLPHRELNTTLLSRKSNIKNLVFSKGKFYKTADSRV